MARKLVIFLVVLAIAALTYGPLGGPSMAMAMDKNVGAAMGDCTIPEGDCCDKRMTGAKPACPIGDLCLVSCLASCALGSSLPGFHLMASAFPFGPSSKSSAVRSPRDGLTSALGFPPFRPPRHSSLA